MVRSTLPIAPCNELLRRDAASGELKARSYRLSVLEAGRAGATRSLDGPLIVGSHPDAGLRLDDPTVSRQHVCLEPRADGVRVRDLGARNGVFIGGVKVADAIVESAVLKLGNTELRIDVVDTDVGEVPAQTMLGSAIGESAAMRRLLGVLARTAESDSTVLLCGETGTGKEVLARGIHQISRRRDRPFVVVDCGALAPNLVESDLFGHVRGAFTGASEDRRGAFLEASGGTLLLDEVGELPLELQPKLLRALESGAIKQVGDDQVRTVNVRVIAATNRELATEVKAGRFRADLYFRLAVITARVPPLRDRVEDIPSLVQHFVRQKGRADFALSPSTLEGLRRYEWPGNVRELRNFVDRALTLGEVDPPTSAPGTGAAAPDVLALPFKEAKEKLLDTFCRDYLVALHERCGGNLTHMAKAAGLARNYVQTLVERYGLR